MTPEQHREFTQQLCLAGFSGQQAQTLLKVVGASVGEPVPVVERAAVATKPVATKPVAVPESALPVAAPTQDTSAAILPRILPSFRPRRGRAETQPVNESLDPRASVSEAALVDGAGNDAGSSESTLRKQLPALNAGSASAKAKKPVQREVKEQGQPTGHANKRLPTFMAGWGALQDDLRNFTRTADLQAWVKTMRQGSTSGSGRSAATDRRGQTQPLFNEQLSQWRSRWQQRGRNKTAQSAGQDANAELPQLGEIKTIKVHRRMSGGIRAHRHWLIFMSLSQLLLTFALVSLFQY